MTLRLTVDEAAWRAHVRQVADAVDGLVPVVKGNGYGFGRGWLAAQAAELAGHVCVGTIHELDGLPAQVTPVVLTPTRRPPATEAILTVGSLDDVAVLGGWTGRVMVKLQSSMRRFGATPDELCAVMQAVSGGGLQPAAAALHLGLAADQQARRAEVEHWLTRLDLELPLWLSHLDPPTFADLRRAHPGRDLRLRLGSLLWHGDKHFFGLHTEVLGLRAVRSGDVVGYRATPVPGDGTVVIVGAGTAHGIAALAGGASPFHHARRRMDLVEPPHMHCSMVHVTDGDPVPDVGTWVDVQRPLIDVTPDEVDWT